MTRPPERPSSALSTAPRQALRAGIPGVVPFNKPFMTGRELNTFGAPTRTGTSRDKANSPASPAHGWRPASGRTEALLTHSCTAALEMAAMLCDLGPGDEVIMPSFTFVSTANAFVLRGATPVFVDIRPDTLNIDETLIEAAITPRTKAIVPVHYAGVGCEMDAIIDIADRHDLLVIEDAAQGVAVDLSAAGRSAAIGHLGALSASTRRRTSSPAKAGRS